MEFSVEFDRRLIFQGFDGIFRSIVVIFDEVKSGENGVFSGFYRSEYRSDFGDFERFRIFELTFECNRCAVPGFRLSVLKCKLRPIVAI